MSHVSPEVLTIILTTSPTPSCPSPELVSGVLASLPDSLSKVPLIVNFDGFTLSSGNRIDGRLKKGQIPRQMADQYPLYIDNVRGLFGTVFTEEEEDSAMHASVSRVLCASTARTSVTFVRQRYRQGFGFGVKSALSYCQTPLLLVLQHDWIFHDAMTPPTSIPFETLCEILLEEEQVKYITFVARQSRRYEHSRGESQTHYKAVFNAARTIRSGKPLHPDLHACLHIFDRPHLCTLSTYRDQILGNPRLRRGDFIEDTVGTELLASIANAQDGTAAIRSWSNLGTWMYYQGEGDLPAIRHTSGRTVLSAPHQAERIKAYIRDNQLRKLADQKDGINNPPHHKMNGQRLVSLEEHAG